MAFCWVQRQYSACTVRPPAEKSFLPTLSVFGSPVRPHHSTFACHRAETHAALSAPTCPVTLVTAWKVVPIVSIHHISNLLTTRGSCGRRSRDQQFALGLLDQRDVRVSHPCSSRKAEFIYTQHSSDPTRRNSSSYCLLRFQKR